MPTSKGRLDPHITSAFTSGATTGTLSAEDRAWFASRGPGDLVKQITVPTFIVEGTADTLFTLDEAITNYEILKANGVPAKMMWFCGGHGVCLTGAGPPGHIEAAVVAWLKRYVGQRHVGRHRPALRVARRRRPVALGAPTTRSPRARRSTATGTGTLALNPADARLRHGRHRRPRRQRRQRRRPAARAAAQIVGEPQLTLTYCGTGAAPATHVFAQIVDEARGVVVGNQATPIPLTLDGQPHTISRPLEAIAASAPAGARYTLQLTGGTQLYGPVRSAAAITFSAIRLELPVAAPAPERRQRRRAACSRRRARASRAGASRSACAARSRASPSPASA